MSENAQDDFRFPSEERDSVMMRLEQDLEALQGQLGDDLTGWW